MKENYPLEDLLKIKIKRFDAAVKIFEEKKQAFIKEEEKLKELEKKKIDLENHKNDKLNQLRKALDEGENISKIQKIKSYLETIKEKLFRAINFFEKQKKVTDIAKKAMDDAKAQVFEKQKEVEKLKMHKDDWKLEMREVEKQIEANIQDELGSTRDYIKKQKKT